MKRFLISDQDELALQLLDEDAFRISNQDVELILNYDSAYALALSLAAQLKKSDEISACANDQAVPNRSSLH